MLAKTVCALLGAWLLAIAFLQPSFAEQAASHAQIAAIEKNFPDPTLPKSEIVYRFRTVLKRLKERPLVLESQPGHRLYRLLSKYSFEPPFSVFIDVAPDSVHVVAKEQTSTGKIRLVTKSYPCSQLEAFETRVRTIMSDERNKFDERLPASVRTGDDGYIELFESIDEANGYRAMVGLEIGVPLETDCLKLIPGFPSWKKNR